MNLASATLLALFGAMAVTDWVAVGRGALRLERFAKPAALALLLAAALALEPKVPQARALVAAAFALSLAGDVLLLPPGRFAAGLAAFLVAHLLLIAGFIAMGLAEPWLRAGLASAAAVGGLLGIYLVTAVRAKHSRGLAAAVGVYIAAISAMVAFAIGTARPLPIAGAVLFCASDALLGWNRFVRPLPMGRLSNIVTYHLAQLALLFSLI